MLGVYALVEVPVVAIEVGAEHSWQYVADRVADILDQYVPARSATRRFAQCLPCARDPLDRAVVGRYDGPGAILELEDGSTESIPGLERMLPVLAEGTSGRVQRGIHARVRIGEKIRVSIGDGHLDRESEAGRAASERRIAKTKARAERG